MLRYTRRALKPNSIGPFHKAIGRDLSSRMKKKGRKHVTQCGKTKIFLSHKKYFVKIAYGVIL